MVGEIFESGGGAVGPTLQTLWIAPVGRHVHVVVCDEDSAAGIAEQLRGAVTAVGVVGSWTGGFVASVLCGFPLARRSAAGRMQRPPLDGPVDQRTPGLWAPSEVVRRFG